MNGALLLIAANEVCPQPQTKEHLMALDIVGVRKIVIVQNKIDIVDDKELFQNYEQIKAFVKGTVAENAPVIPISAPHDLNIDVLLSTIEKTIPVPAFDDAKPPRMYVARSFDVNRPGTSVNDLIGGVLGGSLMQGTFEVGSEIEIAPGRKKEAGGRVSWESITTKITELYTGGKKYPKARPGGLIAIGTELDPSLTKSDGLIGRIAGKPGTLPPVQTRLSMKINLLERVVGSAEELKVDNIKTGEPLMLNVGTAATVGVVSSARKDAADVNLKIPVCGEAGQRVAISRKIGGRWRLIGYGILK
jgi:translation initiation factor 2 subunit 3